MGKRVRYLEVRSVRLEDLSVASHRPTRQRGTHMRGWFGTRRRGGILKIFKNALEKRGVTGSLLVDTFATSYYGRREAANIKLGGGGDQLDAVLPIHTHTTHGHAHGTVSFGSESEQSELLRHRVISQVLELGIIVHSVIIGIALGASQSPNTIRPLIAALSFHQLFEGIGLGGCITQAKFNARAVAIMASFFSLTTPIGIAIGIGIANVYNETSPTALIVQGSFNSASAGILVYMALVDLLSDDFKSSRMQNSSKLQFKSTFALLLGAGCMSMLAKWA